MLYTMFSCFSSIQRHFKWCWGCIRALLNFQHCLQLLNKVDMETADNKPSGCWHPKKLSSANDFLVNLWGALLPGVRQPLPPPLLRRTRKWDGLHYVYCCSSWWAPTWATCLKMRYTAEYSYFPCFGGAGGEVVMRQHCNITIAPRCPLPLPPYNAYKCHTAV